MFMLKIVNHPVLKRDLTILRDKNTPHGIFRKLLADASAILAYEALSHVTLAEYPVETPLETTTGYRFAQEIIIVPILRAGLGMVDGFVRFVPEARIGHVGVYRDEVTHHPVEYYLNLPDHLPQADVFIVDPMLATGGSAIWAIHMLKEKGAKKVHLVSLVAAPEGVQAVEAAHPDVEIIVATLDRVLNENKYILPGLGDAGDRIFGT
ncbi:MAG TPA: uracil phosphoribosyltransferase [Rhodothermales bacterium]|nr:uracil phosphoribosyltransferase [Bacteroidota bacterium]HRK72782.1 uracil phosphoribosyltransferase [Rhodothermales bacterium]HRR07814.1 uracil phosphoribosyltransferase [Rhodothermales bacterium]